MKNVPLKLIRTDGGTQMRAGLSEAVLAEYAQYYRDRVKMPPVDLYYDGAVYWVGDGFHRVGGSKRAGRKTINANVKAGTRRDAILAAAAANASHGLRRTNADKRRAVETLLRDEEWGKWSDREIARRCAVSHPFVTGIRSELTGNGYQYDSAKRAFTHHKTGKPTTMDTSNIGKRANSPEPPADEPDDEEEDEPTAEPAAKQILTRQEYEQGQRDQPQSKPLKRTPLKLAPKMAISLPCEDPHAAAMTLFHLFNNAFLRRMATQILKALEGRNDT